MNRFTTCSFEMKSNRQIGSRNYFDQSRDLESHYPSDWLIALLSMVTVGLKFKHVLHHIMDSSVRKGMFGD